MLYKKVMNFIENIFREFKVSLEVKIFKNNERKYIQIIVLDTDINTIFTFYDERDIINAIEELKREYINFLQEEKFKQYIKQFNKKTFDFKTLKEIIKQFNVYVVYDLISVLHSFKATKKGITCKDSHNNICLFNDYHNKKYKFHIDEIMLDKEA